LHARVFKNHAVAVLEADAGQVDHGRRL